MDSQVDKKNNFHFPITTYKKSKTTKIQTKFKENHNCYKNLKRSSSQLIPQKFVPKLKPMKIDISPTYFILNEEDIIYEKKELNDENHETKSVKDLFSNDDMSLSSLPDYQEEQISDKIIESDKMGSNDVKKKLDFNDNNSKQKRKYLSSIFLLRKKLQKIKTNTLKINRYKDINILDFSKKYTFNDICKKIFLELKNENKNYNNYNNENKLKRKPLLIFDVLYQTAQLNNL